MAGDSLPASRSASCTTRSSPRSAYDGLRGRSEPRVVEPDAVEMNPESGVCGLMAEDIVAKEELAYDSCVNAADCGGDRDDDVCVGVTSGYG